MKYPVDLFQKYMDLCYARHHKWYRKRKHKDSPLFLKISDIYRRSILKKYSNVISDVSHNAFEFFFQSSLNCLRIRWIRRSLDILRVFFGATVLFFLYAGFAKNSYRDGVNNRKRETDDKSVELLFDNKKMDKYNRAIVLLLLRTEDNEESRQLDTLDWLLLANHHKEYGHDELCFEAAYMAHLKDHERIKTNSEYDLD